MRIDNPRPWTREEYRYVCALIIIVLVGIGLILL